MKCSYFEKSLCKSCSLLDKSYEETLHLKEAELRSLFPQEHVIRYSSVGLENGVANSRSKSKLAVFLKDEKITFGFYSADGLASELENCPLHAEGLNDILKALKPILEKYAIIPYNLATRRGELKYIILSKSDVLDEFLLRFVLRSKESLDRLRKAVLDFQNLNYKIKVITANIQPEHKAVLEGDEEILLSKDSVIIHHFDQFRLALGARSFFRVTPEMARKLYASLSETLSRDRPQSLIDLYCGVGAFSFYASTFCQEVVGVEISSEAIACAKHSALLNERSIAFYSMDVEDYLKKNSKTFEAIVVNPPRRGLNAEIIKNIIQIAPKFLYYSSCNAQTMAREYEDLHKHYDLRSLQIFDMFPYTTHFETFATFVRKV